MTAVGRPFWDVLHIAAHNYDPATQREAVKHLFAAYQTGIIPCEMCTGHFNSMLAKYPLEPNLSSKRALATYVNMLHNEVNKRIGKPLVSLEASERMYAAPFRAYAQKAILRNVSFAWLGALAASVILQSIV
jgi:hypothetical protein